MSANPDLAWVAERLDETPHPEDEASIRRCLHDYFDGWFAGDPERMARALHPRLSKLAIDQDRDRSGVDVTTRDEMVEATVLGLGRARDLPDRAIRIEVTGVAGNIASATVRSAVYTEFVLLARDDGRWLTTSTVWRWAPGHGPRR